MGRKEGSGWGTHVYLWWIHFDIWQNQYNIVKFKNKIKLKKKNRDADENEVACLHRFGYLAEMDTGLQICRQSWFCFYHCHITIQLVVESATLILRVYPKNLRTIIITLKFIKGIYKTIFKQT